MISGQSVSFLFGVG